MLVLKKQDYQTYRCLLCDKDLYTGASFYEFMFVKDIICFKCRKGFKEYNKVFYVDGCKVITTYVYNEHFKEAILLYKELFDEALCDIFLYRKLKWLKRRYKNKTLIPVPSGKSRLDERGFNHLIKMFQNTGLNVVDCLYKKEDYKQVISKDRSLMANNIMLKKDFKLPKSIVLIDDICSSGNSLRGCIRVLAPLCKVEEAYCISSIIR